MSERKPASSPKRRTNTKVNSSNTLRAEHQATQRIPRAQVSSQKPTNKFSQSQPRPARVRQSSSSYVGNASHGQTRTRSNVQPKRATDRRGVGEKNFSNNIWTKDALPNPSKKTSASNNQSVVIAVLKRIGSLILKALLSIGAHIISFFNKSTKTRIIGIVLVVLIVGGIGDSLVNMGKIFPGVKVGTVDIGGKTPEEASMLLNDTYQPKVSSSSVVFYADQNALDNPEKSETSATIEEQISYEESLEHRTQWTTPASEVGAQFNGDELAKSAFEIGRDSGGLLSRVQCLLFGYNITPECTYDEELFNSLRTEMSSSVGDLRVNYGVQINNANASVTEGHDGKEVSDEWLRTTLNDAFCGDNSQVNEVLKIENAPLQITKQMAESTANTINNSIELGAAFEYEGSTWSISKDELSRLITTEVRETNGSYELKPLFNAESSKSILLSKASDQIQTDGLIVTFNTDNEGSVRVSSNTEGKVPEVSGAINELNDTFFVSSSRQNAPVVTIPSVDIPNEMSFDDAISYGLIGEISSYTTQFSSGAEARNHNIRLACSLLTNSITRANGGLWSFNDTAGETTEELGYQNAGAIVDGEYTDEIGGGVCQVATTIYNAIYDAGYPITERHNHTLYIASYPEGRDAAIAYPYYDLVWENDSSSDVLLVMSTTNTSVTATLYGVSPDYIVSTEYGEWIEGEKYTTKYKDTDELPAGTEKLQTSGTDGREITIVRTVKDSQENVRSEQTFTSVYDPKDEVILRGTA